MAREIELKLALDAKDEAAFLASKALAGIQPTTERLLAVYFDTPKRELAENAMALRLRRSGRRWVQTLKAGKSGTGGLHERSEWEYPTRGPHLDLARFADTPLAKLHDPARLHERLRERFRVDSERTTWNVVPAVGTRLEVVLDRGTVAAGRKGVAIHEVEIESIAGDSEAVFALALRLVGEVALRPSAVSKAERGDRLASGARLAPVKASDIEISAQATPIEAARVVIGTGLAQLQANEEGLLATNDPEFVHQARVALRRVRSALRMFRSAIGDERAQSLRDALGETGRALGDARDWDVFGTEVLPPLLASYGDRKLAAAFRNRSARKRRAEREKARAVIGSQAHARAVLETARWLSLPEPPPMPSGSLVDFASDLVRKRHKRLVEDGARLDELSAAERHALRIDVKRLRYSIDALASLFPAKRVGRYIDLLVALQDALGQSNDAVTAARLLPQLDPPEPFTIFARGWLSAQAAGDREVLAALLESLAAAPRFWRHARADAGR